MNQVAALRKQQNERLQDKQGVPFLHSSTHASPVGMTNKGIPTKRTGSNGESKSSIVTRAVETNVLPFRSFLRFGERDDSEPECYDSLQRYGDIGSSFSSDICSFYSASEDYSSFDSSKRMSPAFYPTERSRENVEIRCGDETDMDIQRSHDAAHPSIQIVLKDFDDSDSESEFSEITWSENSDLWLSSTCNDEESLFFQSRLSCTASYSSWFKDDASTLKRRGSSSWPTSWTIQVMNHLPNKEREITFKVFPNDCPYPSCLLLQGHEIVECVQTLLNEDHKIRRGNRNIHAVQTFYLHFKERDVTAVIGRDSIIENCRSLLRQLPSDKAVKQRNYTKSRKIQSSKNSDSKRRSGTNAKVNVQTPGCKGWRWMRLFRWKKNLQQNKVRA